MGQSKKRKIGVIQAGFMIGTAVLFDIIQALTKLLHFIPAIGNGLALMSGWFISICAWIIFLLWFIANGINPFTFRRMIRISVGGIIEMVPILNALPGWTISITLAVLLSEIKSELPTNKKQIIKKSYRNKR